jgi:hypothetical protein
MKTDASLSQGECNMFANALAVASIVILVASAFGAEYMDRKDPFHVHKIHKLVPVAALIGVLWLIFG